MQYLVFEFEDETAMRETANRLWDQMGVSGEMAMRPLANGHWRLEITAEKELRDATLEKFSAFRVEPGD